MALFDIDDFLIILVFGVFVAAFKKYCLSNYLPSTNNLLFWKIIYKPNFSPHKMPLWNHRVVLWKRKSISMEDWQCLLSSVQCGSSVTYCREMVGIWMQVHMVDAWRNLCTSSYMKTLIKRKFKQAITGSVGKIHPFPKIANMSGRL